ncbi:hypothetical protein [Sterolibacterium denitrificans]|uniref:hypothetical protein n=1 Tax=Sterolibacterium denitrificans TaxID=157592 RepID=UPI0012B6879C|nr:hypothetical protein [Sterolibacterium denitrificans]
MTVASQRTLETAAATRVSSASASIESGRQFIASPSFAAISRNIIDARHRYHSRDYFRAGSMLAGTPRRFSVFA